MLKLTPNPTFKTNVQITIPGSDLPVKIEVTFRHKNKDKLKAFLEGMTGRPDDEILDEVIESWQGPDEAYSKEALQKLLLNYPASGPELLHGYIEAQAESRRKNSPR